MKKAHTMKPLRIACLAGTALICCAVPAAAASPAHQLLVSGASSGAIHRYDESTGAYLGNFGAAGQFQAAESAVVTPEKDLLVADATPRHVVVEQCYRHFLRRPPEQGGGNGWTGAFLGRLQIPDAWKFFVRSAENYLQNGRNNTSWTRSMFRLVLGREATAAELSAIVAELDAALPPGTDATFAGQPSRAVVAGRYTATAEAAAYLSSRGLDVSFAGSNRILRYDGRTGALKGVFATVPEPARPCDMAFGPDGHLYVTSPDTDEVLRFDGITGDFLGVWASGDRNAWTPAGLDAPTYLTFSPEGDLYVSSFNNDAIFRYGSDGTFIAKTPLPAGYLSWNPATWVKPEGLALGPGGELYVASYSRHQVLVFDRTSGALLRTAAAGYGLAWPRDLAFRDDGALMVGSLTGNQVLQFHPATGSFLGVFASGGGLNGPAHLLFTGNLDRSPSARIGDLSRLLDAWVSRGIADARDVDSAQRQLAQARDRLDSGAEGAAANILGAFRNHIRALENSRRLAPAYAARLIDEAQAIIDQLNE